jgi:hypothetical protein
MSETAKLVSKGEQRFCPVTNRVISTIYGLTKDGEIAVIDTCVSTVEDFTFWCGLNIETMKAIERHNAEQHIKSLPKRQRRKPSNVIPLKARG